MKGQKEKLLKLLKKIKLSTGNLITSLRLNLGLKKQAVIVLNHTFFTTGKDLRELQSQLQHFKDYNKIYIIIPEVTMHALDRKVKRGSYPNSFIAKKAMKAIYDIEKNSQRKLTPMGNNLEIDVGMVTYMFPNETTHYSLAAEYGIRDVDHHPYKNSIKLLVLAQKYNSLGYDSFIASEDAVLCRYALRRYLGHLNSELEPERIPYYEH